MHRLTPMYVGFLVFVTPISLPFAIYECYQGHVQPKVWLFAALLYILSGLGITLGYHRLATHRAFDAPSWVKRILLISGTLSLQGPPASWASLHLQHHRFSDKPGDPHSPHIKGFWHAHCGWLFTAYHPDFRRFGKWLLKDPDIRHVSKYYIYYSQLSLIIPTLLAGWTGFLWAGCVRLFVSSHVTWGINSICHSIGTRDHRISDNSRNNSWMALLSFGEGWHNNHHRFMQAPFFSQRWYQIDPGKWILLMLHSLGLVWDLKIPHAVKKSAND